MRSLFTKIALVATLVTVLPGAAHASQARVDALGLQTDYVQDYVNILHYPSTIVRYQHLAYGDLGIKDTDGGDLPEFENNNEFPSDLENSARTLGAYVSATWLPGVWGVQLNENYSSLSPVYGSQYYNRNRNEGFTIMWGQQFGGLALGAQINNSQSSFTTPLGSTSPFPPGSAGAPAFGGLNARQAMNAINEALGAETRNSTGVAGGASIGWDSNGRKHTADFGAQVRFLSLENEIVGVSRTEDDGNMAFAINARAQFAISDNSYLVPVGNYYDIGLGTEFTDLVTPANNATFENSVKGFQFGLAEAWVLRETDLLMLGISLTSEKVEWNDPAVFAAPFEATYSQTPALFGAVEVHPTGWLHLRAGAGKPMWSKLEVTNPAGAGTVELKDSPIQYALGLGFRIGGRLDLDALVNQDFAFTGTWAASGTQETPFSRLSMTYRW
ncbi:MAG: hypothetical protein ACREOU_06420 [Candidatus Eiseniibacteriota bacterium]